MRYLQIILSLLLVLFLAAATTSPNKGYTIPTPFSDNNTWGTMLQGDLNIIDQNLGGNCTVAIASPSTTATPAQAQCGIQKLTGTLSQNTTYVLPAVGGFWVIDNETAGNFTLTIVTTVGGSSGFAPAQGAHTWIHSDGANIFQVAPSGIPPSGAVGGDLSGNLPNPTVTATHLTSPLPSIQGGVPAGFVMYDSATPPPAGWALGDGSAISRTANPNLNARYAAAGYPYGAGDGSTTLNLPDCRARYIAGGDASNSTGRLTANTAQGISAATLGNTGGEQSHTPIIGEMASHGHNVTDPGHSHGNTGSGYLLNSGPFSIQGGPSATYGIAGSTASATTGISIQSTGGGSPFNEIPPSIIFNCAVKIGSLDGVAALAANDPVKNGLNYSDLIPHVGRLREAA